VPTSDLRRAGTPIAVALVLAVTLAGCAGAGSGGTISGGGSSAQEAAMAAFRAGFQTENTTLTVNYEPIGSGGGREQFISGGYPFAGTDSPLDAEELAEAEEVCGAPPIEIPNYISPIAVIYNLPGVDSLRLDGETVAAIFAGEIATWDDPRIAATNPGADLPATTVTPVHRSDESGTSENFTDYLAEVAPKVWPHGEVGQWPINHGEAAQGTAGVVDAVRNGSGTIGYADASQSGRLSVAQVKVGEDFVGPSAKAAARILEVSPRAEGRPESSMAIELDRATEEAGAYPIVLISYVVACPAYDDARTAELVKAFLSYVVSEDGQRMSAGHAGSAPLSPALAGDAQRLIDQITQG
jgi:phosphate transport system substrate-binding protein